MNQTAIFTILFMAAAAIFCGLAWKRLSLISLGKQENRFDNIPARIKEMLLFAFGQKKVLARPFGLNHFIIFWSFLLLLVANGEFLPCLGVGLFQGAEEAVGDGGEDVHMFGDGEEDQEG